MLPLLLLRIAMSIALTYYSTTMGSKKKRDEKKKDFQKTKLRVGKKTARPDNYTDTSFTAKLISLPNQALARKSGADTAEIDLTHQLLLTKHHLAATRKEVLAYITAHLPASTSLYKQILTVTLSLSTDPSALVREAFVALLAACAAKQPGFLELHMRLVILFVHSAMTHIRPDVRGLSTNILGVLVARAPGALVLGHFVKTLRSYFSLMAWTLSGDKKAVSLAVNLDSLGGASKAVRANHLGVLKRFLDAALFEQTTEKPAVALDWGACTFLHPHTARFMVPMTPQAYTQLKLYADELPARRQGAGGAEGAEGAFLLADVDTLSTEDQETRRKVTLDVFVEPLKRNLANVVRDGGEAGKEAAGCLAVLERLEKLQKTVE